MNAIKMIGKVAASMAILLGVSTFQAEAENMSVDAKDFNKISVSGAMSVTYAQAPTYMVVAQGTQHDLENLDIHVSGNTLYIGRKPGIHRSGNVSVEVMGPSLNDASISGASNLTMVVDKMSTMRLYASGASKIKGQLKTQNMIISCSGASNVTMEAECENVKIVCSGASRVDLKGSTGIVSGSCSGASNVKLNGSAKEANVHCSGASSLSR